MHYEISYDHYGDARRVSGRRKYAKIVGYVLLGIAIIAAAIWSTGMDFQVTEAAFEEMATHLSMGESLKDAFTAFCLVILHGA